MPYLDLAYQGFGDGIDARRLRGARAGPAGASFFVANSFSKSMSVYGERAGALSVVCPDAEAGRACARPDEVDGAPQLFEPAHPWRPDRRARARRRRPAADVGGRAAQRCASASWPCASRCTTCISAKVPGRDFGYFLTQRGMFSYTGLSAAQVDRLRDEYAVYLVRSGRICVAGLNSGNVERTAAGHGRGDGRLSLRRAQAARASASAAPVAAATARPAAAGR